MIFTAQQKRFRLIYFFLLFTGFYASSAITPNPHIAQDLSDIHHTQLQVLALEAMLYHLQHSSDKQLPYAAIVNQVNQLQKRFTHLNRRLQAYNLTAQKNSLKTNLENYLRYINTTITVVKNNGVTSFSVISGYFNAHDHLLTTLNSVYRTLNAKAADKVPALIAHLRSQALLAQMIQTACNDLATKREQHLSAVQINVNQRVLDTLVSRFVDGLQHLQEQMKQAPDAQPLLKQISTDWQALSQVMALYPQKPLPFLLDKLTKQIIAALQQLETLRTTAPSSAT